MVYLFIYSMGQKTVMPYKANSTIFCICLLIKGNICPDQLKRPSFNVSYFSTKHYATYAVTICNITYYVINVLCKLTLRYNIR